MTIETQKIDAYINSSYPLLVDTFSNLSKNLYGIPLVADSNLAYNFDRISNITHRTQNKPSADSLYIAERIFFIEFKGGYLGKVNPSTNTDVPLQLEKKIIESYNTFITAILPNCTVLRANIKIKFAIVYEYTAQNAACLRAAAFTTRYATHFNGNKYDGRCRWIESINFTNEINNYFNV